jgi:hypothetical protein
VKLCGGDVAQALAPRFPDEGARQDERSNEQLVIIYRPRVFKGAPIAGKLVDYPNSKSR